jgi:hypothetical protein
MHSPDVTSGEFLSGKNFFPKTSNTSLLKTTFIHANVFVVFLILFTPGIPPVGVFEEIG